MMPRIGKFELTMAAMQAAMQAAMGIKMAKMDDGKVDGAEAADIATNALVSGAMTTGLSQVVVYQHGESATDSTGGRIAAGLIAAGTQIQHLMGDGQLTLGECLTALRTGMATAFRKA